MKIKKTNDALLEALKDRKAVFEGIYSLRALDDTEMNKIAAFKRKYDALQQYEKDIWYLSTQMNQNRIAELYEVDKGTISRYLKDIKEKLK